MPSEKLNVEIRLTHGDKCEPTPAEFVAKPGSTVTFRFADVPNADIIFTEGSPFEEGSKIKPGQHKVRADVAPESKFKYEVRWLPRGQGNGSGTVIGGGS